MRRLEVHTSKPLSYEGDDTSVTEIHHLKLNGPKGAFKIFVIRDPDGEFTDTQSLDTLKDMLVERLGPTGSILICLPGNTDFKVYEVGE